jgi:hypothetical protein
MTSYVPARNVYMLNVNIAHACAYFTIVALQDMSDHSYNAIKLKKELN